MGVFSAEQRNDGNSALNDFSDDKHIFGQEMSGRRNRLKKSFIIREISAQIQGCRRNTIPTTEPRKIGGNAVFYSQEEEQISRQKRSKGKKGLRGKERTES